MNSNSLAKNTTFFTAAMAIQKALSFIYFIFVARILGVENTGKFSFALSFTTIFAMFLDFGLNQVLIRQSAQDSQTSQKNLSRVLSFKILGATAIYGLIVVLINLMDYPAITRQMVYLAGVVMIVDSFVLSFYGILRGRQNLKFESFGVVANQVIILMVGLIVLKFGFGLVTLISVYLLGSLFNFIYAGSVLKQKLKIILRPDFNWSGIAELLKLALPFGIAGIFIRIYSSIDIVILSKLASDYSVGLYSVAYKITFALQFLATAFSAGVYPNFCRCFAEFREKLAGTFEKSIRYLMILALPISFGVIIIADKIVGPVFGREYQDSVLTLQIMISALVLIFLNFAVGALLNAGGRQTRQTIHLGITAGANIVFNLILIPRLAHLGAALATVLSYLILFSLGIAVAGKIVSYSKKKILGSAGRIFLSTLAMAGVVLFLKEQIAFWLVIPIGAIVYFLGLVLLREITKVDLFQFKRLVFSRRLPAGPAELAMNKDLEARRKTREKNFSRLQFTEKEKKSANQPIEVCLPVYSRPERLPEILEQLKNQTIHNFNLNVWNNSGQKLDFSGWPSDRLRLVDSPQNLGSQARFYLVEKTTGNPIVFLDDDLELQPDFLEYNYQQYLKFGGRAVIGWYSRIFTTESYWRSRTASQPGLEVDYLGTGGMIINREIFDREKSLVKIPEKYCRVEDLYLCFVARMKYGLELISIDPRCRIVLDDKNQFLSLADYKEEAFKSLRAAGWKLLIDDFRK